jgi:hypothetical protein
VFAAPRINTLQVDLVPRIEAAVGSPERFAVDVPHVATSATAGEWARSGGQSVWQYTVRVPGAVSMSFHAARFQLPPGASLRVTSLDGNGHTYSPTDGGGGELWSRLHRGDSLNFELRVATRLESQVELALRGVQAGYRVLGGGSPDHPHFRKLQNSGVIAAAAVCSQSFDCHDTPENAGNGNATAAIVIGGVALCSATLVNNGIREIEWRFERDYYGGQTADAAYVDDVTFGP